MYSFYSVIQCFPMSKQISSSKLTPQATKRRPTFTEVLEDVSVSLDRASFDDDLKNSARELAGRLKGRRPRDDDPNYWNARNVLAEVYDHFGQRGEAIEVTKDAEDLKEKLAAIEFGPKENTLLRRAQIRHVLFWGQVEYRKQEFEKAEAIIKFCDEFVRKLLDYERQASEGRWPHWKTRGLISYFLGRVYRHQNRLDEAVMAFEESINCYYQRAHDVDNPTPTEYSYYRLAKALSLGVGWVKLALGQYREALRQNLMPASILLESTQDELNKNRVLLLAATAEIALAGDDKDKLEGAVRKLQQAKKVFEGHPHYTAKAARECCLAHSKLRQFDEAREDLDEFEEAGSGASWKCQHLILTSLMELDRAELAGGGPEAASAARKAASDAFDLARHVLDKIEALIARGRARFLLDEFAAAKKDFEEALTAAREGSSITTAACYIHLARTCAKLREAGNANSYLQHWKVIEAKVEDEALRKFAQRVSQEVASVGGFVIGREDEFLDYRSRFQQLRRFLENQARSRGDGNRNDQTVAKKLGLTPIGLKGWRETIRLEDKVLKSLKDLCNLLQAEGERNKAVQDFERLLDEQGAFTVCRKVLLEQEEVYGKIFRLARDKGPKALSLTVEKIVEAEPRGGLFTMTEKQLASELLRKRLGNSS